MAPQLLSLGHPVKFGYKLSQMRWATTSGHLSCPAPGSLWRNWRSCSHKCICSHQQGLGGGAMLLKLISELKSPRYGAPTTEWHQRGWLLLQLWCPSPEVGPATWWSAPHGSLQATVTLTSGLKATPIQLKKRLVDFRSFVFFSWLFCLFFFHCLKFCLFVPFPWFSAVPF